MPQPKKITSGAYRDLVKNLAAVMASGLALAKKTLEYQRLKTYWEVGRLINMAVTGSNGTLVLTKEFYTQVSADLEISTGIRLTPDNLLRTAQFHRNYPVFPANSPLTFTHYKALQRIKDPAQRRKLEKTAITKGFNIPALRIEIAQMRHKEPAFRSDGQGGPAFLSATRGEPYIYHINPVTSLTGTKTFRIDLGFKFNIDIPEGNDLTPSRTQFVRSVKQSTGKYVITLISTEHNKIYTYAARVTRVVDGDTIDCEVDLGFGTGVSDRLRFKGVDAPEIRTDAGALAKQFVEEQLKACPLIVIRSFKAEMYGRWLADIFYLPGCSDVYQIAATGKHLNQELLDNGLASVYV